MAQPSSDKPFLFDVEEDSFQDLLSKLQHFRPTTGLSELYLYGLEELGKQGLGAEETPMTRWREQKDFWQKLGDMGREGADLSLIHI